MVQSLEDIFLSIVMASQPTPPRLMHPHEKLGLNNPWLRETNG